MTCLKIGKIDMRVALKNRKVSMTLEEFKNKKIKLEKDIEKLLEQFEEETKSIIVENTGNMVQLYRSVR